MTLSESAVKVHSKEHPVTVVYKYGSDTVTKGILEEGSGLWRAVR